MKRIVLIALLTSVGIFQNKAMGGYNFSEICIIAWGDGLEQLPIEEPYREYSDDLNGDTIGFMVPGDGPGINIVDKNDNIYIQSASLEYLKAFHSDATLLCDYSPDNANFDYNSYFGAGIQKFYVDSLCRIFIKSAFKDHIVIVDTLYNFLENIYPVEHDSTENIRLSRWGSNDMLSISTDRHGCFIYKNNRFYEGGAFTGWLAIDSYYYKVKIGADSNFYAARFEPPRALNCYAETFDTLFLFDMHDLFGCQLLGVDNDTVLYVAYTSNSDTTTNYIRLYDKRGKILDQFALLPQVENHYLYYIYEPFFRADGCIYQFLCQDDGLHVIKWSKQ